jgi:hypothetical protein
MRFWKVALGALTFAIALALAEYIRYRRRVVEEGFEDLRALIQRIQREAVEKARAQQKPQQPQQPSQDPFAMLRQLQQAQGHLGAEKSYSDWVGWLYKVGPTKEASRALNDLKARAFQPNCQFRKDWLSKPTGQIPIAPETKDLANTAYKAYLDCLARGEQGCLDQLGDARKRFMEPECGFQVQQNKAVYNQNYSAVF